MKNYIHTYIKAGDICKYRASDTLHMYLMWLDRESWLRKNVPTQCFGFLMPNYINLADLSQVYKLS
jgi:hypothetical protein